MFIATGLPRSRLCHVGHIYSQVRFPNIASLEVFINHCRGGTRPLPQHYSRKLTDLVRVLLRPVPDKRPSAEQLVMAKILEKELKLYLAYVNGMVKEKEAARERVSSAKAEEEEMLEEVEKSIKENLEEEVECGFEVEEGDGFKNMEKVEVEVALLAKVESPRPVKVRLGSTESGYGTSKDEIAAVQRTSL